MSSLIAGFFWLGIGWILITRWQAAERRWMEAATGKRMPSGVADVTRSWFRPRGLDPALAAASALAAPKSQSASEEVASWDFRRKRRRRILIAWAVVGGVLVFVNYGLLVAMASGSALAAISLFVEVVSVISLLKTAPAREDRALRRLLAER